MEFDEQNLKIWIEYRLNSYRNGINLDYKKARRDLYGILADTFDPLQLKNTYAVGFHATIAGIQKFVPASPVGSRIDDIVRWGRQQIFGDSNSGILRVEDCAQALQLQNWEVATALFLLQSYGQFWDQFVGTPEAITGFEIGSPQVINEYLRYSGFQDLLARKPKRLSSQPAPPSEPVRTASKPNSVFILMPMRADKPELDDVKNAIKEALESFGLEAFRVDDIEHSETITQKVLESIRQSAYVVADLTDERPNVYYEVGYAHAIGHHPILVRKAGTPLHFDLVVHNVPEYRNNAELKSILVKRFENILGRGPG